MTILTVTITTDTSQAGSTKIQERSFCVRMLYKIMHDVGNGSTLAANYVDDNSTACATAVWGAGALNP